jgi:dTDP-4-dehydrorhamnose reductase
MRVVLTGASGQLGSYLVEELIRSGHRVFPWSRNAAGSRCGLDLRPVDLTDEAAVHAALAESDPEVVVHAAAMAASDEVRKDPDRGRAINVDGTRRLASWCRVHERRLVFTSTDLVFDGTRPWYREEDDPRPIMAYGRTKAAAEPAVIDIPGGTVARLSLLYGLSSSGRESFFDRALAALRAGHQQVCFEDEFRTPLDYRTAARVLVRLAECGPGGIVHVAGRERVSRFELMRRVAGVLGIDPTLVRSNRREEVSLAEPRPADVSLKTARLEAILPDLHRPSIEGAIVTA